jgi:hypothetical protein
VSRLRPLRLGYHHKGTLIVDVRYVPNAQFNPALLGLNGAVHSYMTALERLNRAFAKAARGRSATARAAACCSASLMDRIVSARPRLEGTLKDEGRRRLERELDLREATFSEPPTRGVSESN